MESSELKVVHVSPRVQARGGIETLHAYHRDWPVAQQFVALFDRQPAGRPGYTNLDFTWRTPLWRMRQLFARALAPHAGATVIYHNGWGLPLLQDLDGAARRVVFLHADPAYHAPDLPSFAGLVDGAIGVTPALQEAWARTLPELPAGRTVVVRAPVEPPVSADRPARPTGAPLIIGYAGRLERAQKRLDLLPDLLRALRAAGVDFRFELLGDGSFRPWLEKRLAGQARFHGWCPKDQFWRVMARWDAMVMLSEHEGGPIALLEGMAVGVLPFYPARGGSWGDVYAPQVDPLCHYPAGNMSALTEGIRQLMGRPEAEIAALRQKARDLVAGHRVEAYNADCLDLVRRVQAQPRLSRVTSRQPRWSDLLPLGVVTRGCLSALR